MENMEYTFTRIVFRSPLKNFTGYLMIEDSPPTGFCSILIYKINQFHTTVKKFFGRYFRKFRFAMLFAKILRILFLFPKSKIRYIPVLSLRKRTEKAGTRVPACGFSWNFGAEKFKCVSSVQRIKTKYNTLSTTCCARRPTRKEIIAFANNRKAVLQHNFTT